MGYWDELAPGVAEDRLTDEYIMNFMRLLIDAARKEELDPSLIKDGLKGMCMKQNIASSRAQVYLLAQDYSLRMADIGCEISSDNNQKKVIEILTDSMQTATLRLQLKEDLEYMHNNKKDWKPFLFTSAKRDEHEQSESDSMARLKISSTKNDHK